MKLKKWKKKEKTTNTVIEFKIKLEKEMSEEEEINYKIIIKMLLNYFVLNS